MDKFFDVLIKVDTIDTSFYALEKFVLDEINQKTPESANRLECFFYLLWEQMTEARKMIYEISRERDKDEYIVFKYLEEENKALKKKLSEFPYA